MHDLLSIGHSTLEYSTFARRLKSEGVTAIADVRSTPYSRHQPHFSQSNLSNALSGDGIAYVFLGTELGGRPAARQLYTDGIADYEKMAQTETFLSGISRLLRGAERFRIAMMCSEGHPLDCHRCLLVGRHLKRLRIDTRHLLPSGNSIRQSDVESKLLAISGLSEVDMFSSENERIKIAYRKQSRKAAFSEN
tara:strand:- start:664 stop:1242 length:579 start_codon:yes stop_codon:yes gene_type:complete